MENWRLEIRPDKKIITKNLAVKHNSGTDSGLALVEKILRQEKERKK